MKPDDGGPAFPCVESEVRYYKNWNDRDKEWVPSTSVDKTPTSGMSLRDYFAAKAMQALIANPECCNMSKTSIAEWAYNMAVVMLKEREK